MPKPKLTVWDKLAIARLEIRGARRALADIQDQPDVDQGIARIKERARRREQREQNGK